MKVNLTRIWIMTAVALISASAACAQDQVTVAVPFAFRAAGANLDAGTYSISQYGRNGYGTLMLVNQASRNTKFVNTVAPAGDSTGSRPKLVFRCGDENKNGCALSSIRFADGRGWVLRTPRMKPSEKDHVATIYLDGRSAE